MNNFTFYSPTLFAFGEGEEKNTGSLVKQFGGTKVLLVYGSGSVKRNGAYDGVTASLTEAGMDKADEDSGNYIRVYFQSKINESAGMDEVIPNTAALEYTNSTNYTYSDSSDTPEVVTGGFCLVKVDGEDQSKLAGAEFTLYRDATEAEIAAAGTKIRVDG